MHNEAQVILKHLFNRSSLDELSVDELSSMAEQYPYFNALQFLLAKKRKGDNGYPQNGSHPSMFFSNPLWFEFLMNHELAMPDAVDEDEQVLDSRQEIEPSEEDMPVEETISQEDLTQPEGNTQVEGQQSHSMEPNPAPIFKPAPILPKGTEEGPALEFEPFHTIDYFASQGIKLQQADLSRDKFGQQLKSFTEWLKSMKRIPPVSQPAPAEVEAQDNVVRIAEHSNESREVYTEAMAEVWAKQGNCLKATEIYQKLSLLNPGKSAYFAAKIEQLNS